jgi:hypothetical protein
MRNGPENGGGGLAGFSFPRSGAMKNQTSEEAVVGRLVFLASRFWNPDVKGSDSVGGRHIRKSSCQGGFLGN